MENYIPRLKTKYHSEVLSKLVERFGYKSVMQAPRMLKICINQGVGGATQDKKMIDVVVKEMTAIAGQKPVTTIARKAISNFKLREGMPIGVLCAATECGSFLTVSWQYRCRVFATFTV